MRMAKIEFTKPKTKHFICYWKRRKSIKALGKMSKKKKNGQANGAASVATNTTSSSSTSTSSSTTPMVMKSSVAKPTATASSATSMLYHQHSKRRKKGCCGSVGLAKCMLHIFNLMFLVSLSVCYQLLVGWSACMLMFFMLLTSGGFLCGIGVVLWQVLRWL